MLICIADGGRHGHQEDYLSVRIHSFTTIAAPGTLVLSEDRRASPFSIRAVRVPDCFAPAK